MTDEEFESQLKEALYNQFMATDKYATVRDGLKERVAQMYADITFQNLSYALEDRVVAGIILDKIGP